MPLLVAHVLSVMLFLDIIRDFWVRFPRFLVLFGGLAALIPDLDLVVYEALNNFSRVALTSVHRTITHQFYFPLIFLAIALLTWRIRIRLFERYMRLGTLFLITSFAVFVHIVLDVSLSGFIRPFYPYTIAATAFDFSLLMLWFGYQQRRRRIFL